jgi:hypothetical protein
MILDSKTFKNCLEANKTGFFQNYPVNVAFSYKYSRFSVFDI